MNLIDDHLIEKYPMKTAFEIRELKLKIWRILNNE